MRCGCSNSGIADAESPGLSWQAGLSSSVIIEPWDGMSTIEAQKLSTLASHGLHVHRSCAYNFKQFVTKITKDSCVLDRSPELRDWELGSNFLSRMKFYGQIDSRSIVGNVHHKPK